MPRILKTTAAVGCAAALFVVPAAGAATKPVNLRVLTHSGSTFAQYRQYTQRVRVHASRNAKCFGPSNPSSNKGYNVRGATLLGALATAAKHSGRLRPLLITDAFVDDGFGMGVCGINGVIAPFGFPAPYWYGASGGTAASTGPDLVPVSRGAEALFYFTSGSEPGFPSELVLSTPARAKPGQAFTVTVAVVNPANGSKSPAAGAIVTGGAGPTDANGHTTVTLPSSRTLRAKRSADEIQAAKVAVCVNSTLGKCPRFHGMKIYGSSKGDRIGGTRGWDLVLAGPGDDRINVRHRGHDKVNCGSGFDRVRVDSHDKVSGNCEVVVHH